MTWTAIEAAKAAKGRVAYGEPGKRASGISTDTRTMRPGQAFIALSGPNFNGHDFLQTAASKGAPWVMAEKNALKKPLPDRASVVEVEDTLQALGRIAARHRSRFDVKVAAITGSIGKTTTKEMAAAVLSTKGKVLKSRGNLNNRIGMPLTLLDLNRSHKFAVLEIACNMPGEILELTSIAAPHAAMITGVGPVHLEGLGSVQGVARAKAEMIKALGPKATFILNLDDPMVRPYAKALKGKVIGFSKDPRAQFKGESLHVTRLDKEVVASSPRIVFEVERRVKGRKAGSQEFVIKSLSHHDAVNALAALALGRAFGVGLSDAARALKKCAPLPGRGNVLRTRKGGFLIDESYNANPVSMDRALETLAWWASPVRKLAVLGEMMELGPYSKQYHGELGEKAARAGVHLLVAAGPSAKEVISSAVRAGLPKENALRAGDSREAARLVKKLVRRNDWVLVKGSRAMGLERVVESLEEGA